LVSFVTSGQQLVRSASINISSNLLSNYCGLYVRDHFRNHHSRSNQHSFFSFSFLDGKINFNFISIFHFIDGRTAAPTKNGTNQSIHCTTQVAAQLDHPNSKLL
jgi:hypothetical protein